MYNITLLFSLWLGQLFLVDQPLPFNFDITEQNGKPVFIIHNAEERIVCDIYRVTEDSMFVRVPVFDSEFKLRIEGDRLRGKWVNYGKKGAPEITFMGYKGVSQRFTDQGQPAADINGKWETWFDVDSPDSSIAIGVFNQDNNHVTGTFLTETGDHRYLEGSLVGRTLKMSVFDGTHAWLYVAEVKGDSMNGMYYSGTTYKAPFHAKRNPLVKLRDPNTITSVEGKLDFSFPDLDSTIVSLHDTRFKNKPVIIQIMGSWCPNCMDETVFLNEFYKARKEEGVEVIGLAFERSGEFSKAKTSVSRLIKKYDVQYPFLIAGVSGKDNVLKQIPQIKNFISFPTSIYLDRKGNVVKVHAGFAGPATGEEFEKFKKEFNKTMDKLIR